MRGASALDEVLRRTPDPGLRVLVVWEPVLSTDREAPLSSVLARIADRRVRQFWDEGRLVSGELLTIPEVARACGVGDGHPGQDGIVWDAIALYPPGATWDGTLPPPAFVDSPVIGAIEEVGRRLSSPASAPGR
jgi:hypothetical protein